MEETKRRTESTVVLDIRRFIEPFGHGLHKGPRLALSALGATAEILSRSLSETMSFIIKLESLLGKQTQ